MVVLVGSGHVAYGLGIERQARAWFDGAVSSVIAVPLADDKGPDGRRPRVIRELRVGCAARAGQRVALARAVDPCR